MKCKFGAEKLRGKVPQVQQGALKGYFCFGAATSDDSEESCKDDDDS